MAEKKKTLITLLILIAIFILIALNLNSLILTQLNNSINNLMVKIQFNFPILLSKILSYLFETSFIFIISLIFAGYLFFKGKRKESIIFILTIILSVLTIYFLKNFFMISRPLNALMLENDFSFPSGHSSIAVVIIGFLAYFFGKKTKINKKFLYSLSILIIVLTAFSRLYLNVHWFSDVLGGLIIGTIWLLFAIFFLEKN